MFIHFRVRNYRSLRDEAVFSVEKRGQAKELPENCFHVDGLPPQMSLLKSSVLYGGNASGKSNLIRALDVMQDVVRHGGVGEDAVKPLLEPFRLADASADEPLLFEAEVLAGGRRYRYGFECTRERIVSEWLYAQKQRMTPMFVREGDHFIASSPEFSELAAWRKILADTRLNLPDDALFLSTAARMFAGGSCETVQKWFENTLVILSAETYRKYLSTTFRAMQDRELARHISRLIAKADFGIQSVETLEYSGTDGLAEIGTNHLVGERNYRLDMFRDESAGTQKVFALSASLLDVLRHGKALFIDELDAGLHPLLVAQLVELFHVDNPANAQMVATAHSPSILTETTLRHDQVWFVSKDAEGTTTLASLADFTGIRGNFTRIAKDYLHGCFGGVPYIKNLRTEDGK